MNEGQVKIRILILQILDWLVFIAIVSVGVYLILNSEDYEMAAIAVLAGLFVVSKLGNFTRQKIAQMKVNMDMERKRNRPR